MTTSLKGRRAMGTGRKTASTLDAYLFFSGTYINLQT